MSIRTFARTLLAGIFVVSGWEALQDPRTGEQIAEEAVPLADKAGLPTDPARMVKLNGAVQFGAGVLMMAGWMPRLAALALAASLVPTTYAAHRFWEIDDPADRRTQLLQALKNGSILGGLLLASLDRGGRPSIFWSTRKAAERTGEALSETLERLGSASG